VGSVEEGTGLQEMRFRKRPVEVEAIRFVATTEGISELRDFCGSALGRVIKPSPSDPAEAEICTLEDGFTLVVRHIATEGDWVIRGVAGEFCPCEPEIFKATYDPFLQ